MDQGYERMLRSRFSVPKRTSTVLSFNNQTKQSESYTVYTIPPIYRTGPTLHWTTSIVLRPRSAKADRSPRFFWPLHPHLQCTLSWEAALGGRGNDPPQYFRRLTLCLWALHRKNRLRVLALPPPQSSRRGAAFMHAIVLTDMETRPYI